MRFLLTIPLLCAPLLFAAEDNAIAKTYLDRLHRMHVVTAGGRDRAIPPEKGQSEASDPQLASDRQTAGWLVNLWDSCCVSYPIPTELVIWRAGRILRRIHPGQAIFGWVFLNGGKEVAYHTAPLHGDEIYLCARLDLATGRQLESWSINDRKKGTPDWVKLLAERFPMPEDDPEP